MPDLSCLLPPALAFLIAASLGNLQRLVDRKGARLAAAGDA